MAEMLSMKTIQEDRRSSSGQTSLDRNGSSTSFSDMEKQDTCIYPSAIKICHCRLTKKRNRIFKSRNQRNASSYRTKEGFSPRHNGNCCSYSTQGCSPSIAVNLRDEYTGLPSFGCVKPDFYDTTSSSDFDSSEENGETRECEDYFFPESEPCPVTGNLPKYDSRLPYSAVCSKQPSYGSQLPHRAISGRQPTYESQPSYNAISGKQPTYESQPSYNAISGKQPTYESQPSYNAVCYKQPTYESHLSHSAMSSRQSTYESQPTYNTVCYKQPTYESQLSPRAISCKQTTCELQDAPNVSNHAKRVEHSPPQRRLNEFDTRNQTDPRSSSNAEILSPVSGKISLPGSASGTHLPSYAHGSAPAVLLPVYMDASALYVYVPPGIYGSALAQNQGIPFIGFIYG